MASGAGRGSGAINENIELAGTKVTNYSAIGKGRMVGQKQQQLLQPASAVLCSAKIFLWQWPWWECLFACTFLGVVGVCLMALQAAAVCDQCLARQVMSCCTSFKAVLLPKRCFGAGNGMQRESCMMPCFLVSLSYV